MNLLKSLVYPTTHISRDVLVEKFSGRWVVLTGASHGIGRELANRLIEGHANLYLIARTEGELQEVCRLAEENGCECQYRAIDLRNREDLDSLCNDLKTKLPMVDFFFANAGKSIHRKIADAVERLHDYDRTMDLNYRSFVAMTLALHPQLKSTHGRVIYTSSISTLYPWAPGWSAYHASKEAANVWCRTAQAEYKTFGVKVKVAYMPLVHTPMSDATEAYKDMPAYSAKEAADLLIKLAVNNKLNYMPWWARLSSPLAYMISPIIRFFYSHFV